MPDNLLAPSRLKEKLGVLPIWAWGIIGGTIVLLGYYIVSSRKKARVANPPVNSATGDLVNTATYGLANPNQTQDALLPSGYSGYSGSLSDTQTTTETNTIDTNISWLNKGIAIAVQSNRHTPLGSTTALQKYLQGKPLNVYEQDVVGIVLDKLGYPPQGAPLMVKAVKNAVGKPDKVNPAPTVTPKPTVTAPKPTKPVVTPPQPTKDTFSYEERKLSVRDLNPIPTPITK